MVWLDPLDEALYHAVIGRFVPVIEDRLDRKRVLSARPVRARRSWMLEHFSIATEERRTRAVSMLDAQPRGTLGVFDIREYYPSVSLELLASVLGELPIADLSRHYLIGWFERLQEDSDINGLPIGPDGSAVLGNVLLSSADDCISTLDHEFLRYMDDTWVFLEDRAAFERIVAAYAAQCGALGLRLNDAKTRPIDGWNRYEVVTSAAIEYLGEELNSRGKLGLAVARELFEYAAEDPAKRKTELRRSLTALKTHADLSALRALERDPRLLRPAVNQWTGYLWELVERKSTRHKIDHDWILENASREQVKEDAYHALTFLKVARHPRCALTQERGRALFSVATRHAGWQAPLRVLAADAWGHSRAWNESDAIEMVEQMGDYSTRRAFAATLRGRGTNCRRKCMQARKIRLADRDLEPTASWLESGA